MGRGRVSVVVVAPTTVGRTLLCPVIQPCACYEYVEQDSFGSATAFHSTGSRNRMRRNSSERGQCSAGCSNLVESERLLMKILHPTSPALVRPNVKWCRHATFCCVGVVRPSVAKQLPTSLAVHNEGGNLVQSSQMLGQRRE